MVMMALGRYLVFGYLDPLGIINYCHSDKCAPQRKRHLKTIEDARGAEVYVKDKRPVLGCKARGLTAGVPGRGI